MTRIKCLGSIRLFNYLMFGLEQLYIKTNFTFICDHIQQVTSFCYVFKKAYFNLQNLISMKFNLTAIKIMIITLNYAVTFSQALQ